MLFEAHNYISIIASSCDDHCKKHGHYSNSSVFIIPHCSLRANGLTDTGATTLAMLLQHNKSLEKVK